MSHNLFNTLQAFTTEKGKSGQFYSLPRLEEEGVGPVSRLPVSLRVVLESVLRNYDEKVVEESDVRALANWRAVAERTDEIPFSVARVLLQDFTGVPLLVDLAAMRSAVQRMGRDPKIIEPLVPVDLVIDHSVQVDFWSSPDALRLNMRRSSGATARATSSSSGACRRSRASTSCRPASASSTRSTSNTSRAA